MNGIPRMRVSDVGRDPYATPNSGQPIEPPAQPAPHPSVMTLDKLKTHINTLSYREILELKAFTEQALEDKKLSAIQASLETMGGEAEMTFEGKTYKLKDGEIVCL